jgi:hypothetical protein
VLLLRYNFDPALWGGNVNTWTLFCYIRWKSPVLLQCFWYSEVPIHVWSFIIFYYSFCMVAYNIFYHDSIESYVEVEGVSFHVPTIV